MAQLSLSLLGPFQVTLDDKPITEFEYIKGQALLAYLAVETGYPHSRDKLAEMLWPDQPQGVARRNLRQVFFKLRQAFGDEDRDPPFLLVTRQTLEFNLNSPYRLDISAFTDLVTGCTRHPQHRSATCKYCAHRLEQGVALYRGDFLEQLTLPDSPPFEEWVLVKQEWLRRQALEALAHLSDYYEGRGAFSHAIRHTRRQLELDSWREEAHRQLMRLHTWLGERSAALMQYQTCRRILTEELGIEPAAGTTLLYERIRDEKFGEDLEKQGSNHTPTPFAPRHNLPPQTTPFIGREEDLTQIARLLADPTSQLVTLVGPGGVGKTRLALQAATKAIDDFLDGVYFVSLAPVDPTQFPLYTLAEVLNLSLIASLDPRTQLLSHLQGKEMLLILDNFEHLVAEAWLLAEILTVAPDVKFIVTSRERLNLHGEWVVSVPGLSCPPNGTIEGIEAHSAVQLFLQSARRIQADFSISVAEAPFIIRICRLVEGMPLAIELAATWTRAFTCQEIAAEIEHDLDFLTTSLRGLPTRHQSLRAVFDHSWQLLSQEEKVVSRKLSLFRGSFQREAAQAVSGASLPVLSALVDKSLLRWNTTGQYNMHELLRQYASEKLQQLPSERETTQDRYSHYYAEFLQQRETDLKKSNQQEALAEIGAEIENIRAAWHWAVGQRKLGGLEKSLESLYYFYEIRGRFQEGQEAFQTAIERLRGDHDQRQTVSEKEKIQSNFVLGQVLARQSGLLDRLGRYEQAEALLRESLAIFERLDARKEKAFPLQRLGYITFMLGRYSMAKNFLDESLTIYRENDDHWGIIISLNHLGDVIIALGMYEAAEDTFQESLALSKAIGSKETIAWANFGLGDVYKLQGKHRVAKQHYQQSLTNFEALNAREGSGWAHHGLGDVAGELREYTTAKQHYQRSLTIFEEIGDRAAMAETLNALANAHLNLEEYHQARESLANGLQIALETQSLPVVLAIMGRWAIILIASERAKKESIPKSVKEEALELLAFTFQHPASDQETKDKMASLLTGLESQLPSSKVKAIHKRVKTKTLENVVGDILR